jgi:nucleotide-binding universal stress UspA family protein
MNIVVLLTDQEDSQAALDWAVKHAKINDGTLHVVTAADDIPGKPAYVSPHYLAGLDTELAATGVDYTLHDTSTDPANQVIRLVNELPAELAVVGLRKRSATFKLILGSHARHVVVNAACPVVTVKQEHAAA